MSVIPTDTTPSAQPQGDGKSATLAELRPRLPVDPTAHVSVGFGSVAAFELLQRVAKMFASSSLVPKDYRDNPGNCAIAVEMANRMRLNPMMVMQNLRVVMGNPGWSGKFLIARFNESGKFDPVEYEWGGTEGKDDWSCRAFSKSLKTGKRIQGPKISMALAKAEGWVSKNGSKWTSMPEKMFMYRAAAWMIDVACPEIAMGLPTEEELLDRPALVARHSMSADALRDAARTIEVNVLPEEPAIEGAREPGSDDDKL